MYIVSDMKFTFKWNKYKNIFFSVYFVRETTIAFPERYKLPQKVFHIKKFPLLFYKRDS